MAKKVKTYVSARKLDSLPVGSKVTWNLNPDWPYNDAWTKGEKGWSDGGTWTQFIPDDAKTMLARKANRPYRILSIPAEAE